jgi:endonuclease/exonuclease/phosphatase family metal-dependent hydrolase
VKNSQLRILTYNLHKGFNTSRREFTLHRIREALLETQADILFLQEIQGAHSRHQQRQALWPQEPHFEFLAHGVWPHIAYGKNAVYSAGHHGNAILSKYPLITWENINVSPFSWASRSLLHGEIALPWLDETLHIICIHFGLTDIERRDQVIKLCQRIEEAVPANAPLIIAGDFNDWNKQAERHMSSHLNLKEAYQTLHHRHARTWPSWFPLFKMDRIYFRGLSPVLCECPSASTGWNRLSDHTPLLAAFERS